MRLTSVNISYNISASLVGGFAAALATVLVDRHGNDSPGFIISALAALAWIGLGVGSMGGRGKDSITVAAETMTCQDGVMA